ncbi:MAG: F0F1 ATP synthase subunit B [Rhodobacteraceae bacterium]|nr:F0F1 ATP synthase subunit B [Paracoccaceae bacterium]
MTRTMTAVLSLAATPAMAAEGPFLSLRNTEFVVWLAFLIFIAVLIYLKVGGLLGGLLDKRAEGIRADLDAARKLHEEAKAVLAGYESRRKEMQAQADLIVANARREAEAAAEQAKAELKSAIARRLAAAEDQIASAEAAAVREVRDRAVTVAVGAAGDLIAAGMTPAERNRLIEAAIGEVSAKLH